MAKNFFPDKTSHNPRIYAYLDTNPIYNGLIKIGYTTRKVTERVAEQYPTDRPGDLPYKIILDETAMRNDGSSFSDRDIHRYLRGNGFSNPKGEWFRCKSDDIRKAIIAVKFGIENFEGKKYEFKMRP